MALEIKTMLDSVPGVRKDWKEDWKEDARADWKLDWDLVTGAPVNTVAPVASGTPHVGQQLSVTNGTFTGAGITYTRAWKRNGVAIGGATGATYTLVLADLGASITCTVTATNVDGAASATSNALGPVLDIPASTVLPVASGNPWVGEQLSVTNGTWTGGGITYTYEWFVNSVSTGITTATYTVQAGDLGFDVYATVTGTNAAGASTVNSNTLGPVLAVPANTVAPVITDDGTPAVGETVTVNTGTWTGGSLSYTYQWKNAGVDLVGFGADTNSYTLQATDSGDLITCTVTATNAAGSANVTTAGITPA